MVIFDNRGEGGPICVKYQWPKRNVISVAAVGLSGMKSLSCVSLFRELSCFELA